MTSEQPAMKDLPDEPGLWFRVGNETRLWVIREFPSQTFWGRCLDLHSRIGPDFMTETAAIPRGNWSKAVPASELAAAREEVAIYRQRFGCLACGEDHPPECICPPHEVRSSR